jgi:hypothetical protein
MYSVAWVPLACGAALAYCPIRRRKRATNRTTLPRIVSRHRVVKLDQRCVRFYDSS